MKCKAPNIYFSIFSLSIFLISNFTFIDIASAQTDSDEDGIIDTIDNCPFACNVDQSDLDRDGIGDVCDDETTITTNTTLPAGEYTFKNLTITNNATLLLNSNTSLTEFNGVKITAENFNIDLNSSLSADGTGYPSEQGPGAGTIQKGYAGGAGYGGNGGGRFASGGPTYGSAITPTNIGSGGGRLGLGGSGGGAIKLNVDNITVNGNITSNGNTGTSSLGFYGGGGSGGSIYIITNQLHGAGTIASNGGHGQFGGGGGGRIAVYYASSTFTGKVEAKGGSGSWHSDYGKEGTVGLFDTTNNIFYSGSFWQFQEDDGPFNFSKIILNNSTVSTQGNTSLNTPELVINNSSTFTLRESFQITTNNLNISNSACLTSNDSSHVTADNLNMLNNGTLTLNNDSHVTINNVLNLNNSYVNITGSQIFSVPSSTLNINQSSTVTFGTGSYNYENVLINNNSTLIFKGAATLNAANVNIDPTSSLSANGAGYSAEQGPGAGTIQKGYAGGAGYGGNGGGRFASGGPTYGSAITPTDIGSGGGRLGLGGSGGGAIKLNVDNIIVNGNITSNGNDGTSSLGFYGGGGSGGSIYILTNQLNGTGTIKSNGGYGQFGGGGGGRIAVYYASSTFTGKVEAKGGSGSWQSDYGKEGTVGLFDTTNNIFYSGSFWQFQEDDGPFNFSKIILNNSTVSTQGNTSLNTPELVIDNNSSFTFSGNISANDVTINNSSSLTLINSSCLAVNNLVMNTDSFLTLKNYSQFKTNNLNMNNNSTLTLNDNSKAEINNNLTYTNSHINITGSQTFIIPFSILNINEGSTVTLGTGNYSYEDVVVNNNSSLIFNGKVTLDVTNLSIDTTSSLSAKGTGYPSQEGPGGGKQVGYDSGGAGYGGKGGGGTDIAGSTYGSAIQPQDLGSGGGHRFLGGEGGGAIKLIVSNILSLNGIISANGNNGRTAGDYQSGGGGGSGGSIYIITNQFNGTGTITSNGGASKYGGGGGRIAVYYSSSTFTGGIQAKGGSGRYSSWYGGAGTVIFEPVSLDTPITPLTIKEEFSTTDILYETLLHQEVSLNNITLTGDLEGAFNFSGFKIIKITSGPFAEKGFFHAEYEASLEGAIYQGTWQGVIYPDLQKREIHLKGVTLGGLNGIVETILTESTPESGSYDKLQSTCQLNRMDTNVIYAILNLEGDLSYQSSYTFSSEINLYQASFAGVCMGQYNGHLSLVMTYLRLISEGEHQGEGFSIVSYNTNLGSGEGWFYNNPPHQNIIEFEGLFKGPLPGVVFLSLNENTSPKTLSGTIERLDLGLPPAPDLSVKVWGQGRVSPGQTVNYIIEYRNDGLKSATQAILNMELPIFSEYISASQAAFYNDLNESVSWDLRNINPKTTGYLTVQVSFSWGLPEGLEIEIPAYIALIEHFSTEENLSLNGINLKTKQLPSGEDNPQVTQYKTLAKLFDATWIPVYEDIDFYETVPHVFAAMLGISTDKNKLSEISGYFPKVLGYSGSTILNVSLLEKSVGPVTTNELHLASTMVTHKHRLLNLNEKGVDKVVVYYSPQDDLIKPPYRIKYSFPQNISFTTVVRGEEREPNWIFRQFYEEKYKEKILKMVQGWETIASEHYGKKLSVKTFNLFSDIEGNQVKLEMQDELGNPFQLTLPDGTPLPEPFFYIQNNIETGKSFTSEGIIEVREIPDVSHGAWPTYLIEKLRFEKMGRKIHEVWKNVVSFFKTLITTARDPNEKLVSPIGDVEPGDILNYTINYENEGEGIAFGVYITDTLDEDLDDTTLVINNNGSYDPETGTITWFIGEVQPHQEGSVSFSINVKEDVIDKAEVINFATVYFPSVPEETRTNGVVNIVKTTTDTIPPTTQIEITPSPNEDGWYNSDVAITLTVADNEDGSGVKEIRYTLSGATQRDEVIPGDTTQIFISNEGTATLTYYAIDNEGNIEPHNSAEFKLDKTPPDINYSLTLEPNDFGWHNNDVTVVFTGEDTLSGVKAVTEPQVITTEGQNQYIGGETVDYAGNVANTYAVINIDKTSPTIIATFSVEPNSYGWNNADVTVSFTASDNFSGIQDITPPITVTREGANQIIQGEATDFADNKVTTSITLNIDKTHPAITITATPDILWPPNHKMVDVVIDGESVDNLSGVVSNIFKVEDEYNAIEPAISDFGSIIQLEASREGNDKDGRTHTISVTSRDKADNESSTSTTVICPHDQGKGGKKK